MAGFSSPAALVESARQIAANDEKFWTVGTYFFELKLPSELAAKLAVSSDASFIYPLVLPPENISLEEPFTIAETPTLGGGLYVEENGIVRRILRIRAHTGFKPRPIPGGKQPVTLQALKPEARSFTRNLPAYVFNSLSGMKHFQYLQDAVFRTYADLKRDPATSNDTQLIFHDVKHDEHWIVAPRNFRSERDVGRKMLYPYDIELLVLDRADAQNIDVSEDKGWVDQVKDTIRSVKAGIDLVNGAIQDITALTAEITNLVKDFGKIIDGATQIVSSAADFVEGVVDFIQTPLDLLNDVQQLVDSGLELQDTLRQASEDIRDLPNSVRESIRQIGDGLDLIGQHPEAFAQPARKQMQDIKNRQQLSTQVSQDEFTERANTPAETTLQDTANLGTGLTPGDETKDRADFGVNRNAVEFTSSRQYVITKGDTLVNLASRFLGDARLWQHIAVTNGLKPPFLDAQAGSDLTQTDEAALPNVSGIGRTILIPSFAKPPERQPLLPVLGTKQEQPPDEHLLGVDIQVKQVNRNQVDFVADVEGGSTDVLLVRGIDNLKQALTTRIDTERGTATLYRTLGMKRVIGLGIRPVDLELARFRITEALQTDSRIAAVRRLSLTQESPGDILAIDADLEVRGFSQTNNIKTPVQVVI